MKLTWDNIDSFKISKSGYFVYRDSSYPNHNLYTLKSSCNQCGCVFLSNKYKPTNCCSHSCIMIGKYDGVNNPFYGKTHSDEYKATVSKNFKGVKPKNYRRVKELNIPFFDVYSTKLIPYEEVREGKDGLLEVTCLYCNKYFIPKCTDVIRRVQIINGTEQGSARFYCSDGCKKACPIYGQILYPKGFKKSTSREVQAPLRKLVLARDNWTCQKCSEVDLELHCHHIDPVVNNPVESADVDNCITLCKTCHIEIHKTNKNCINKC